ncbi:Retrovirus-related Pol polyprotein from transposon 17.6, partial [Dictyocoela roeselum]
TPNLSELLSKLKGSKIFSVIDLNQGYYQIKMAKKDKDKTGFKILNRKFVFNKMPFGLCNAPHTFQSGMNKMFHNTKNAMTYLDDILIYNNNIDDHFNTLTEVFKILNENTVSINFEKSKFCCNKIDFLGHEISEDGIKPNVTKIEGFISKIPKTKKQLERTLGLINWFGPFIKNLSSLTSDLYERIKDKSRNIKLSEKEVADLTEIYRKDMEKPKLYHPDLNEQYTLKCDASDKGLDVILIQNGKLVGIFSKKYNKQELNYSSSEKEALAVTRSLMHFKPLVYNSKVEILKDNKNILFKGPLTKRLHRMKFILEESTTN